MNTVSRHLLVSEDGLRIAETRVAAPEAGSPFWLVGLRLNEREYVREKHHEMVFQWVKGLIVELGHVRLIEVPDEWPQALAIEIENPS